MSNLSNVKNFIGADILNLQIWKAFKFINKGQIWKRFFNLKAKITQLLKDKTAQNLFKAIFLKKQI